MNSEVLVQLKNIESSANMFYFILSMLFIKRYLLCGIIKLIVLPIASMSVNNVGKVSVQIVQ